MAPTRSKEGSAGRFRDSVAPSGLGRVCVPRSVCRFLFSFVVLAVPFYLVMGIASLRESIFKGYLNLNAQMAGLLVRILEEDVVVRGTGIFSSQFSVSVKYGCDAFEPSGLFIAAVLAFPVPLRPRLIGCLVGVTALFALNLVRIASLFFIGAYFPEFFSVAHVLLWQALFVFLTITLWFAWARWVLKHSRVPT